ncbi:MAG: CHAT domain-containing protein [Acidobacteriota bacterium]
MRQAAINEQSAPAYHALGEYYLATGDFEKAIENFEKALTKSPNDAKIHSDLGAAYLETGKLSKRQEREKKIETAQSGLAFGKSFEHLQKALELDGSLLTALFNLAILRQEMDMSEASQEEAWQKYLEKDRASKWASEAQERIEEIQNKRKQNSRSEEELFQNFLIAYQIQDNPAIWDLIRQNYEVTGGKIEHQLITGYFNLCLENQEDRAEERLEALSYLGQLLKQKTGDCFIYDLANFYQSSSHIKKREIAQAYEILKRGQQHILNERIEEAIEDYRSGRAIMQNGGDRPDEVLVDYLLGHAYLLKSDPAWAFSTFEQALKTCVAKKYKWFTSQILQGIAIAHMSFWDYSKAIYKSNAALTLAEELENPDAQAKALHQLGSEFFYLKDYSRSLNFYLRNLQLLNAFPAAPRQKWRAYISIAQPLGKLGLHTSAIEYQKQALQIARDLNAPLFIWRSYALLGATYADQGDFQEALNNVEKAIELGKSLPDERASQNALAQSFLQRANLYKLKKEYNAAIQDYDQAIELYESLGFKAFDYSAFSGKLLSCIAQGECSSFDKTLETTLNIFDRHRSTIREQNNRDSFFESEQAVFDAAIDHEFSIKGNPQRAFEYSEKCRARSLLDLASTSSLKTAPLTSSESEMDFPVQPMGLGEIQAQLPQEAQIVQYQVMDSGLIVWVLSRDNFSSQKSPIDINALNHDIAGYLDLIKKSPQGNRLELKQSSEELYKILIEPIEGWLDKNKQLCIVPDKILNRIPFAALFSEPSQKYLLEEFKLCVAPSSTLFILSSIAALEKQGVKNERLLSVGNPAFDHQRFPDLEDLPSAGTEAENIKRFYAPDSSCLVGKRAIKKPIEREMARVDIIHLALHSIIHEKSPLLSKLLLTSPSSSSPLSEDATSELTCGEIYNLNLKRPRLVILSACSTAVEGYYGAGMLGIARPFIAKSIPLVVASLWAVDSPTTKDLMIAFHQYRKKNGMSTVAALRQAQLDILQAPDERIHSPYYWAAFVTIGGCAGF